MDTIRSGTGRLATAEVEAERQRTKEQKEQKSAAEAAVRYASEAAALKRREQEEATQDLVDVGLECIVPSLKGDSLSLAQRALSHAHCRLGKVSRLKGRHDGRLVVTQQRVGAGARLANGMRVGVTLGRAPVQERVHGKTKK